MVYKGCRFRSYQTSRNRIKWRCNESSKRSGECRARVVTDEHLNLINECPPYVHNHELPTMEALIRHRAISEMQVGFYHKIFTIYNCHKFVGSSQVYQSKYKQYQK